MDIAVCCALLGSLLHARSDGECFCRLTRLRFTVPPPKHFVLIPAHRPTPKNTFVSIGRRISAIFSTVHISTVAPRQAPGPYYTEAPPPTGCHSRRTQGPFSPLIGPHRAPRGYFFAGSVNIKVLDGKIHFWPRGQGLGPENIFQFLRHLTPLPHTAKRRYGARAPLAGWL